MLFGDAKASVDAILKALNPDGLCGGRHSLLRSLNRTAML